MIPNREFFLIESKIILFQAAIGKVVVKFGNGKLVLIVAGIETSVIAKGKYSITYQTVAGLKYCF